MLVEEDRLRSRAMCGLLLPFKKLRQREAQHSETADAKSLTARGPMADSV